MDTSYILNGRINLFDENAKSSKILNNDPQFYNEKNISTINRNVSGNCVSEIYFSQDNMNIIQLGIYNSVYNTSEGQYKIGKQSEQELKIIMRSFYLQYAKNLNFDLKEQVKELNTMVIRWCVDEIIKNITNESFLYSPTAFFLYNYVARTVNNYKFFYIY